MTTKTSVAEHRIEHDSMGEVQVPVDARPGKYTAYVFGAQESCYVNYDWPTKTIEVTR